MLLRYEDLVDQTDRRLSDVLDFTGLLASDEQVASGLLSAGADRMVEVEDQSPRMTAEGQGSERFARQPVVERWRTALPEPPSALISQSRGSEFGAPEYPKG